MSTVPFRGRLDTGRLPASEFMARLNIDGRSLERLAAGLPFSRGDTTCGVENELQTAVIGPREAVDLPLVIEDSNYFQNIRRRHRRGELPKHVVSDLERWLADNAEGVWENSWVRFPKDRLTRPALQVFEQDLRTDKRLPGSPRRSDACRFILNVRGEDFIRAPVSYLLKLALVDVMGRQSDAPDLLHRLGSKLAAHYLSDNTSPETYSFYVTGMNNDGRPGQGVATETALRFLLTDLLAKYAGGAFGLNEAGQRVEVYFAPHPPVRQKGLNDCISDSFYRELFMNPCLSGWDLGEEKHRYMHLCHEVLSRAQLSSLAGLKEAGIVARNLVVLPSTSNISLANNGTHISLGSRRLSEALKAGRDFRAEHEKYYGDLVIKFVEHFLPLFVGTYSAAPYRLSFSDFHPEKVLSFLPYQLDYTHLRMIWRRWRKKARLKARLFGFRLTPFGPPLLDATLSRLLHLRGDLVPDFRLLDYMVSLMSTDQCPALDGRLGNQDRLKQDLGQMGVFDPRMPVYMLYRQRVYDQVGFSGFEGRHYSLFERLQDMAEAGAMQNLVTALAFQFICREDLTHAHIPDGPEIESERRQIFFGAAIGLPTFFVREDTSNLFLRLILERTRGIRPSRRYPGFLRVKHREYRLALLRFLRQEGADLMSCLGVGGTVADLASRIEEPERFSASGRLTRGVLERNSLSAPLEADAVEFNRSAEVYYREVLKRRHLAEAFSLLEERLSRPWIMELMGEHGFRESLWYTLNGKEPLSVAREMKRAALSGDLDLNDVMRLINLVLLVTHQGMVKLERHDAKQKQTGEYDDELDYPPVHRAAKR